MNSFMTLRTCVGKFDSIAKKSTTWTVGFVKEKKKKKEEDEYITAESRLDGKYMQIAARSLRGSRECTYSYAPGVAVRPLPSSTVEKTRQQSSRSHPAA